MYNSTKARQVLFHAPLKRIRVCLTCCGYAVSAMAFFSSVAQLETLCQETPACREIVSRARVCLSCDCIINVASAAASYLHPLANFSKVFAHAVTVLGISYLWLRPTFAWLHPLLSKLDNMTPLLKRFLDSLHVIMKQVFAALRSMAGKLFKNMPVVLQGFEYFKKVEKMDTDANKMQDIGKVRQSFLEKVRRKMEQPLLQRLWCVIKMLLKVTSVAACVGAALLLIGKWPWTALEHVD